MTEDVPGDRFSATVSTRFAALRRPSLDTEPPASLPTRSPWRFFLLVVALAVPLWMIGAVTETRVLTGLGADLPIAALTFLCPIIAAFILIAREEGSSGVRRLLKRVIDVNSVTKRRWYGPMFLLLPLIYGLSYGVHHVIGTDLPTPQPSIIAIVALFAVLAVSAASEEAGWMGYAADPLQDRWPALTAAVMLGVLWAAVHIVPDLQAGRTCGWIAGQRSFSLMLRILIVWLYNNTGASLFAATLFHATDNVSVFTLFPHNGVDDQYNPAITAAITAVAAAVVTYLWGPRTLNRFRSAH